VVAVTRKPAAPRPQPILSRRTKELTVSAASSMNAPNSAAPHHPGDRETGEDGRRRLRPHMGRPVWLACGRASRPPPNLIKLIGPHPEPVSQLSEDPFARRSNRRPHPVVKEVRQSQYFRWWANQRRPTRSLRLRRARARTICYDRFGRVSATRKATSSLLFPRRPCIMN
jgi:hypothetical protein